MILASSAFFWYLSWGRRVHVAHARAVTDRQTHYEYFNLAPAWALKRAFILSHRKQASGATDKAMLFEGKNPTGSIRAAIKIYSFNSTYFRKQTDKQAKKTSKQLLEGRWADRPTTTTSDRSTTDARPPPPPPTAADRRTTDRPSMIDDARSLFSATVNRHMKSYIQTTLVGVACETIRTFSSIPSVLILASSAFFWYLSWGHRVRVAHARAVTDRQTHYKYCNLAPAWALKRAFILSHRKQASGATDKQCDSKQNSHGSNPCGNQKFIHSIHSIQTRKQASKQASKQTNKQANIQRQVTHIMHTHKHTHTGTHRSSKQSSKQYNASKNKEARYFFNSPFFFYQ